MNSKRRLKLIALFLGIMAFGSSKANEDIVKLRCEALTCSPDDDFCRYLSSVYKFQTFVFPAKERKLVLKNGNILQTFPDRFVDSDDGLITTIYRQDGRFVQKNAGEPHVVQGQCQKVDASKNKF